MLQAAAPPVGPRWPTGACRQQAEPLSCQPARLGALPEGGLESRWCPGHRHASVTSRNLWKILQSLKQGVEKNTACAGGHLPYSSLLLVVPVCFVPGFLYQGTKELLASTEDTLLPEVLLAWALPSPGSAPAADAAWAQREAMACAGEGRASCLSCSAGGCSQTLL